MLLKNGNVFDGEQFLEGMEVRLAGDIVAETGYDLQASDGEKIIDLAGDYLLPGFVDVHIHAFKGRDTMNGEEAVRSMSRERMRLSVKLRKRSAILSLSNPRTLDQVSA